MCILDYYYNYYFIYFIMYCKLKQITIIVVKYDFAVDGSFEFQCCAYFFSYNNTYFADRKEKVNYRYSIIILFL